MNLSQDYAQLVAQIQQECMLEARRQYEGLVTQELLHRQAIIEQLEKDKLELYQFLCNKLHEVCLNTYIQNYDPN